MRLFSQAINVLLPVFYLVILFIYGIIFFTKNKKLARRTNLFLLVLICFHGLKIILRSISLEAIPLASVFDALSFFAFSMLSIYYLIETLLENKTTGFIVLLLPFLLQLASSVLYQWEVVSNPLLNNPVFAVHAATTIIGYSGLAISALYALMYIMLYHNIKYHHFGIIYNNLPSLDLMEKLNIRSVLIGIILLGAGIILGHLRTLDLFGSFWLNDPKIIVTDFIWLGYFLGYLFFQLKARRGRWMAYLSVSGFVVLSALNLLIFLFFDTFHHFK